MWYLYDALYEAIVIGIVESPAAVIRIPRWRVGSCTCDAKYRCREAKVLPPVEQELSA